MNDLIRRLDALNAIAQYCMGCDSYNGVRCKACEFGDAIDAVEDCEAVDAEPVRHGKWGAAIIVGYDGIHPVYARPCSECGYEMKQFVTRYCPRCGARMDGGDCDG